MVHTISQARNHIVAGDYLVYGWITDDRKHLVRIMKLNEDYTNLANDVVSEIDCPPGHDGKLMVGFGRAQGLPPTYHPISRCATTCGYLGNGPGYCL